MNTTHNGPMRVLVALPDHGAHTRRAQYVVKTANGDRTRTVVTPGDGNRWVSLGAYMFNGYPEVRLSSITTDGTGDEDIAVDAMAFVPITGTYKEQSVEAVAHFDEDQDIDTKAPSSWMAGIASRPAGALRLGHRSSTGILACPTCGTSVTDELHRRRRSRSARHDLAQPGPHGGHRHGQPPRRHQRRTWIGFAQKYTDRPTTTTSRPAHFDDDDRYKIKTKATASYIVSSGAIVDGSEWVEYENRTGNTHLPEFVRNLVSAVSSDYGIARARPHATRPGTSTPTSASRRPSTPGRKGILPGRAYAFMGKKPTLVDASGAPSRATPPAWRRCTRRAASIGYRPFLGAQDGVPADRFGAWVKRLEDDPRVSDALAQTLRDFHETFTRPGLGRRAPTRRSTSPRPSGRS